MKLKELDLKIESDQKVLIFRLCSKSQSYRNSFMDQTLKTTSLMCSWPTSLDHQEFVSSPE